MFFGISAENPKIFHVFFWISAENPKKHMEIQNFEKFLGGPIVLEILDLEIAPQNTPLEIQEKPQFLLYYLREIPIEKLIEKLRKLNMLPYMIYFSSLFIENFIKQLAKFQKSRRSPILNMCPGMIYANSLLKMLKNRSCENC